MFFFIQNIIKKRTMHPFWLMTGISIFMAVTFIFVILVTRSGLFGLGWLPLTAPALFGIACLFRVLRAQKMKKLLRTLGIASGAEADTYLQNSEPLADSVETVYWVSQEYLINFNTLKAVPLKNIIWLKKSVHCETNDNGRVISETFEIQVNIREPKRTDILYYSDSQERDNAALLLQKYCGQYGNGAKIIK